MNLGKIALLFFCLFFSFNTDEIETVDDVVNQSFQDDMYSIEEHDTDSLRANLEKIQKEKLNCIYSYGINIKSIERCIGSNFSKVEDSFIEFYNEQEAIIETAFDNSVLEACEIDSDPCQNLKQVIEISLRKNVSPIEALSIASDKAGQEEGVNKAILRFHVQKFISDYNDLEASRPIIAHYAVQTIEKMREFIQASGITIRKDLIDHQPNQLYVQLGFLISPKVKTSTNISTVAESEDQEVSVENEGLSIDEIAQLVNKGARNQDEFNDPLLEHSAANKMVKFYLKNPKVNIERLDLTKMPLQILQDINILLKEKNIL